MTGGLGSITDSSRRTLRLAAAAVLALVAITLVASASATPPQGGGSFLAAGTTTAATAATLPQSFQDAPVISGLTNPTALRFSPDGRIFVAEDRGIVKEYDSLSDTTPTTVIDLTQSVDQFWDRGLLGMVLDPNFPANPYIYVDYAYDAPPGGTAPTWNDGCPTPPGATTDGCVIQGRVSRLTISGNVATNEQVLLQGWCQQFPSHSMGDLQFGADGYLYVSGGEGANFNAVDYGQYGGSLSGTPTPANPCGDPPSPKGTALIAPNAEGGALRSQSVRRTDGPTVLNGAILRIDPSTGAGAPTNPLSASADANARRIIAYGFRNPFRFTIRPGTNDVWVTDVGWNDWEEIDRIPDPTSGPNNYGWPCYEGNGIQPGYQAANLTLCNNLYAAGSGGSGTFGDQTVYTSVDSASLDQKVAAQYTASAGNVTKLTGYISGLGGTTGTQPIKAVIYADSGGQPGALLGTSNAVNVAAGRAWGWTDFTFTNPVAVQNGPIWLGYIAGSPGDLTQMRYASQPGAMRWSNNPGGYAAGPSNPFGAGTSSNKHYSLYATYSGGSGNGTTPPTPPYFTYNHAASVVAGDGCPTGGSSVTGDVFYTGNTYPSTYKNALFFMDHTRDCIWAMLPGSNGLPDPTNVVKFETGAAGPVDIQQGPDGNLYYVNYDGGTIQRITYTGANNPPVAIATSDVTSGPVPLTVNFDGSGSSDPDGDPITYSWDLNGDGVFGDSTAQKPSFTYTTAGTYNVKLRVTDSHGATTTSSPIVINAGNHPPVPVIDTPASTLTWRVGTSISFSGHATDAEDGTEPASRLSWTIILHHCFDANNCHTHLIQTFAGVAGGSFSAPDHGYPCWLEVQLTATDATGTQSTTSVRLDPQTVNLTLASSPTGAQLSINSTAAAAPTTTTVVIGSTNSIAAPSPQTIGGQTYAFTSWSDGGAASHNVTAPATDTTYTATFTQAQGGTFGDQTVYTSVDSASLDLKEAAQYTATAGNVTKLTGYISGLGGTTGTQPVKAVIYADSGGQPGALLGTSNAVNVTAGQPWAWTDFTFANPVAVQNGPIWLGYIAGAPGELTQLRYLNQPGAMRWNANAGGYGAGPSNPFGTGTSSNKHYSLYATYTTSGGGGPPTTFGDSTVYTSVDSAGVDLKEAAQYTATAGNVTKLTGYISGLGGLAGTQQPVKAVIYADNNGQPGALLGTSNTVTVSAGQAWAWVDFTFANPVAVQSGPIWLGYIAGSPGELTQLRYLDQPGAMRWNSDAGGYADGPSNPFGAGTSSNKHYSLYATLG